VTLLWVIMGIPRPDQAWLAEFIVLLWRLIRQVTLEIFSLFRACFLFLCSLATWPLPAQGSGTFSTRCFLHPSLSQLRDLPPLHFCLIDLLAHTSAACNTSPSGASRHHSYLQ